MFLERLRLFFKTNIHHSFTYFGLNKAYYEYNRLHPNVETRPEHDISDLNINHSLFTGDYNVIIRKSCNILAPMSGY